MRRLPGISLAVVLPGYNVFKKLSSCHPGRGEGRKERKNKMRREGRKKETERSREAREREVVSIHKPQLRA